MTWRASFLLRPPPNVAWRWKGWDPSAFLSQGIQAAQPDGFSWGKVCREGESPVW